MFKKFSVILRSLVLLVEYRQKNIGLLKISDKLYDKYNGCLPPHSASFQLLCGLQFYFQSAGRKPSICPMSVTNCITKCNNSLNHAGLELNLLKQGCVEVVITNWVIVTTHFSNDNGSVPFYAYFYLSSITDKTFTGLDYMSSKTSVY